MDKDKRSCARFGIRYAINMGNSVVGSMVNLSEGGARLALNEGISDAIVNFAVRIPEQNSLVHFSGSVVWSNVQSSDGYSCGIKFHNGSHAKALLLLGELYVLNFLEKELGVDRKRLSGSLPLLLHFFKIRVRGFLSELIDLNLTLSEKVVTSEALYQRIKKISDEVVISGDNILEGLELERVEQRALGKLTKEAFRTIVGSLVYQSQIMKRAYQKPQGYAGDYRTLEVIYDNRAYSPSSLGYYYDRYFLDDRYAHAVRERKDRMREILRGFIGTSPRSGLRVFNLASGSCREIRELVQAGDFGKPVEFVCLDQDVEALDFSKRSLEPYKNQNTEFKFIGANILNMLKGNGEPIASELGTFDLVYSIGLVDYLPDRILEKLVKTILSLLKPSGILVLTHKDRALYKPVPADWFCEWTFVPRTQSEFVNLIEKVTDKSQITIERNPNSCIFFLTIIKR